LQVIAKDDATGLCGYNFTDSFFLQFLAVTFYLYLHPKIQEFF